MMSKLGKQDLPSPRKSQDRLSIPHKLETGRIQLSEMKYRTAAAEANLNLQEAKLRQAEIDRKRAENLVLKEAISGNVLTRQRLLTM